MRNKDARSFAISSEKGDGSVFPRDGSLHRQKGNTRYRLKEAQVSQTVFVRLTLIHSLKGKRDGVIAGRHGRNKPKLAFAVCSHVSDMLTW